MDASVSLFERRKVNVFEAAVQWHDSVAAASKATYRHYLDIYRDLPQMIANNDA